MCGDIYDASETDKNSNNKASFVIHVNRLQNATWQGTIQWLESNKTQHFRSAMEMLRLMDNALGTQEERND